MIKYIIADNTRMVNDRFLCSPESITAFNGNVNTCLGYNTRFEAVAMVDFLNEELRADECCNPFHVEEHSIIEIENRYPNIIMSVNPDIPFLTIADQLHFLGIPVREYDIDFLRGGDGC